VEAYLCSIIVLLFLAVISEGIPESSSKRHFFIISSSVYLILFSGLRDVTVGPDTIAYMWKYDEISNLSWSQLWDMLYQHYFGNEQVKAPGYFLLQKVVKLILPYYQLYLLFIALVFTSQLGRLIHRESSYPLVSFIVYLCMFFEFFGVTGHRQTVATAISILFGYRFIVERRFVPFLVLVLIASTLHKTALVLIPFYFVARFAHTLKFTPIIFGGLIGMFLFKSQMFYFLSVAGDYEQYSEFESRGAYTFSAVYLMLVCFYFWHYPKIIKSRPTADITINALWFGLIFVPLVFVNPSVMRIIQYFSFFMILAIPDLIKCFNNQLKSSVYFMCVTLLTFLLFKKNYTYQIMCL
jgi:hypothetical protein